MIQNARICGTSGETWSVTADSSHCCILSNRVRPARLDLSDSLGDTRVNRRPLPLLYSVQSGRGRVIVALVAPQRKQKEIAAPMRSTDRWDSRCFCVWEARLALFAQLPMILVRASGFTPLTTTGVSACECVCVFPSFIIICAVIDCSFAFPPSSY